MENEDKLYTYDQILEMLGGYTYYEKEQIDYIYYKLNGKTEKAKECLDYCLDRVQKLKDAATKLKTQEELLKITTEEENNI
jgi:hypothetical protein